MFRSIIGKALAAVLVLAMAANGFVILGDKNTFFSRDIPTTAFRRLKAAADNGDDLRSMTFTGKNGWVLILEDGFVADGLPNDVFKQLQNRVVA